MKSMRVVILCLLGFSLLLVGCGKESPTEISLTEVEQIEQLAIDDPSQAYLKAMDLPIPEMIFSV